MAKVKYLTANDLIYVLDDQLPVASDANSHTTRVHTMAGVLVASGFTAHDINLTQCSEFNSLLCNIAAEMQFIKQLNE